METPVEELSEQIDKLQASEEAFVAVARTKLAELQTPMSARFMQEGIEDFMQTMLRVCMQYSIFVAAADGLAEVCVVMS